MTHLNIIGCSRLVRPHTAYCDRHFQLIQNGRLLDLLHSVFALHGLYYYLISHYGETEYLDSLVWSVIFSLPFALRIYASCFTIHEGP
jgi:hypothetical protein